MGHAPWDCSCDQGEFYGKLHSTAPYIFCKVGQPQATIFNLDADKTFYNPEQQLVFSFAGCHQLLSNLSAYQHSLLVTLVSQVNLLQHLGRTALQLNGLHQLILCASTSSPLLVDSCVNVLKETDKLSTLLQALRQWSRDQAVSEWGNIGQTQFLAQRSQAAKPVGPNNQPAGWHHQEATNKQGWANSPTTTMGENETFAQPWYFNAGNMCAVTGSQAKKVKEAVKSGPEKPFALGWAR